MAKEDLGSVLEEAIRIEAFNTFVLKRCTVNKDTGVPIITMMVKIFIVFLWTTNVSINEMLLGKKNITEVSKINKTNKIKVHSPVLLITMEMCSISVWLILLSNPFHIAVDHINISCIISAWPANRLWCPVLSNSYEASMCFAITRQLENFQNINYGSMESVIVSVKRVILSAKSASAVVQIWTTQLKFWTLVEGSYQCVLGHNLTRSCNLLHINENRLKFTTDILGNQHRLAMVDNKTHNYVLRDGFINVNYGSKPLKRHVFNQVGNVKPYLGPIIP